MKSLLFFNLIIFILFGDEPKLSLGYYHSLSSGMHGNRGAGFITLLKSDILFADFGWCGGTHYYKGTFRVVKDTVIATITEEDIDRDQNYIKYNRKIYNYTPVSPFKLKFSVQPKSLICYDCPLQVDTLLYSGPAKYK